MFDHLNNLCCRCKLGFYSAVSAYVIWATNTRAHKKHLGSGSSFLQEDAFLPAPGSSQRPLNTGPEELARRAPGSAGALREGQGAGAGRSRRGRWWWGAPERALPGLRRRPRVREANRSYGPSRSASRARRRSLLPRSTTAAGGAAPPPRWRPGPARPRFSGGGRDFLPAGRRAAAMVEA